MRSQSGQAALVRRANMILMSVNGVAFNEIRQRLRCDVRFIQRWRERFVADRVAGLSSEPRGRPAKTIDATLRQRCCAFRTDARKGSSSRNGSTTSTPLGRRGGARPSARASANRPVDNRVEPASPQRLLHAPSARCADSRPSCASRASGGPVPVQGLHSALGWGA